LNQTPIIEFRKLRDFGQIFTDVSRFFKFNFKTIFLCVLLIPGPLFLIAGAFNGYLQSMGSNPSKLLGMGILRDPMEAFSQIITVMLPYVIFLVLGGLASTATINRYFILYQQKSENNSITVSDIIKYLPADMWRLFYNSLLLGLVSLLFLIPIGLIAMIPFLGAFVIIVAALIGGPQLAYAITVGNYLVLRDEISITRAISKAWGYMRDNFWWTWLIVVCAALIVGIIGAIFTLPMTIMTVVNNFSRSDMDVIGNNTILYVVLGAITVLGPQLLTPINALFSVMAYHSYEEKEEGTAINEKINQIGKE